MISFAVMHAPWAFERRPWLDAILERVPAIVIEDSHREGIWKTARRAWSSIGLGCTHHMVLQDDFELCEDFVDLVQACVRERPEAAISVFQPPVPWALSLYQNASHNGSKWFATPQGAIQWGGTTILPVDAVHQFLAWADALDMTPYLQDADDERLGLWLAMQRMEKLHTVPELVRHIGHQKSLSGHNSENDWRRGCFYIGDA